LAAQKPFLGFEVGPTNYRTLILQAEVAEPEMQGRFKMQAIGYPPEACELVRTASVFSTIQLDTPRGVMDVMAALDSLALLDEPDHRLPDILVVDPLVSFHTGDENDAACMARVIHALNAFRARDVCTILVHHQNKAAEKIRNLGYKLRGSSVLPGWYDSHLCLEWADTDQKKVRLQFELRHAESPESMVLSLDKETLHFGVLGDDDSQIDLVVSTLEEMGPSSTDQVAAHCHRSENWARTHLKAAVRQKKVRFMGSRPTLYYVPGVGPDSGDGPIIVTGTATGSFGTVTEEDLPFYDKPIM
jgi:hypothetical protein